MYKLKEVRVACLMETAGDAVRFWKAAVASAASYTIEQEQLIVALLNTRRNLIGFRVAGLGTSSTVCADIRTIFREALLANASAIIVMHNHPSGDPMPSEGDIKVTRDIMRAGQLLKVEMLDHVIVGTANGIEQRHCSLREMGYLF